MRPENGALPGMDDLREIIEKNYGGSVEPAKKLNAGFDRNTTVYKVFSKTEQTFFLKIRTGHFSEIMAPRGISIRPH